MPRIPHSTWVPTRPCCDWAVGAESIAFEEIFISGHVVGIDTRLRPDWEPLNPTTLQTGKPIYDHASPFFDRSSPWAFSPLSPRASRYPVGFWLFRSGRPPSSPSRPP